MSGDVGLQDEPILFYSEEMTVAKNCLLYTSPSPRDATLSGMPGSG